MAMYIAEKIMAGQQSYEKVFNIGIYKKYQNDVNSILVAKGRTDLIA